ncbi:porphobilinogen deaminase [Aquipluma nitroreducens]|uniref:Porphobilinogen deaminase n=1 Tax=Aquipluma nitroreducens TaxID=2010828 RepID=A0A5K7SDT8_9BACT|nr:hydroxymethylbilane synthase [Aquipluma nitroreducens]BBE19738.1 porphobilinogen deaminase [Aquipluma nitroreducens]
MKKTIRIGTRGSQLALYQAKKVKATLENIFPELQVELKIIKTKGDKILDVALSKIGDKGLFTKEIENELIDGSVDLAVHSLKDLPTKLPDGLKLGAVLERGEFRDALVSLKGKKMSDLKAGDVVATSSLRRIAGLLKINNQIVIKDIRGNVNSRLQKMEDGYCDAMIMAAAGLQRLGLEQYITEIIDPEVIMPAVSQGAIAIETRLNDPEVDELMEKLNHLNTWNTVVAERAFLAHLEGGCQVPLGCYSRVENGTLNMSGFVSSIDGKQYIREDVSGEMTNGADLGVQMAEKMLEKGAKEILDQIKSSNNTH